MKIYKLVLMGFGNAGQALARLLLEKRSELQDRYSIRFMVTAVATGTHGRALNANGLDLERALEIMQCGGSLDELITSPAPTDNLELIRVSEGDVLFENTPVSYKDGQPAISHIETALENSMHAITANKGAVVHGYHRLHALAVKHGFKFFFESTVMDGVPIFSSFRQLPAVDLSAIWGVLNSTTNLILSRMEAGDSFDEAVKHSKHIGIAETDPSGDIDGWDAAVKLSAMITVLMDRPYTPDLVDRTGIRSITAKMIADAKADGKRYKLVAHAWKEGGQIKAKVSPELVGTDSVLYNIRGTTAIVQFESDVLGKLSFIEEDLGTRTTAYGLLADFINAVTG
ncbi:MAG: homoserine dehydrogenase [Anaerolineales bacterium]|nr:homoserine dehydrogenase [Anaerolineales bacterium]